MGMVCRACAYKWGYCVFIGVIHGNRTFAYLCPITSSFAGASLSRVLAVTDQRGAKVMPSSHGHTSYGRIASWLTLVAGAVMCIVAVLLS
jgi:hypothetical protein